MVSSRRRVRASTITLVRTREGLVPESMAPTPERARQGDVRAMRRLNARGNPIVIYRTMGLVEQLAIAGELGDEATRLLAAAEWFDRQATAAELRGRLVQSQLLGTTIAHKSAVALKARVALAHAYEAIGQDAFNVVYDLVVWTVEPRGGARKALLRAGLHALARWLGTQNAKKPQPRANT